jgi:hypothetical protein
MLHATATATEKKNTIAHTLRASRPSFEKTEEAFKDGSAVNQ